MKHLVLISGNLGTGKTTLAEMLARRLDWNLVAEAVDENPYLSDFYSDMRKWSFHLQVYFLGIRAERHFAASTQPQSAILDRSVYEDSDVFARLLADSGYITSRDLETYLRLASLITKNLRPPNLVLYLRAPIDTLLERVRSRNPRSDREVSREYLSSLQSAYDNWISAFKMCPVITVDTFAIDYTNNKDALDSVIQRMVNFFDSESRHPVP